MSRACRGEIVRMKANQVLRTEAVNELVEKVGAVEHASFIVLERVSAMAQSPEGDERDIGIDTCPQIQEV